MWFEEDRLLWDVVGAGQLWGWRRKGIFAEGLVEVL